MVSSLFSRSFFTDEKHKQYVDFYKSSYFFPCLLSFKQHVLQGSFVPANVCPVPHLRSVTVAVFAPHVTPSSYPWFQYC